MYYDVWEPSPTVFLFGFRYFVTFVDDYSRITWVYLLKAKSDVFFAMSSLSNWFVLNLMLKFVSFGQIMEENTCLGVLVLSLMSLVSFIKLHVQATPSRMVL